MVAAYTTAAVINYGVCRPEEPVKALDYMPNYRKPEIAEPEKTQEQLEAESDYNVRVLELAAQMREGKGDLYEEICLGRKPKKKRSKHAQRGV